MLISIQNNQQHECSGDELSLQEWNISTDIFAQSDGLSDLYGQSDLKVTFDGNKFHFPP